MGDNSQRVQRAALFLGRGAECEQVKRLLDAVRRGTGQALVVRGEAGIGKSALVERALSGESGVTVIRAQGIEPERELAYAAIQQICAPLATNVAKLAPPQASGLRVALGVEAGSPPDKFIVGLAVLGLLAEASSDRPVMLVVDDAQWLDRASAQVLGFVARRITAEPIGAVFMVREDIGHRRASELDGLPELQLDGLSEDDATTLLGATYPGPIDAAVASRVVAESRGNPLALLELPRGFTPAELAGGFGFMDGVAVPRRIEESFRRQVGRLPVPLRQLLLIAACEPTGNSAKLWRTVDWLHLELAPDAAVRVALEDLVQLSPQVTFRHPLLRSAVYRQASPRERRRAHEALAAVTDGTADPERRAWHRAQAAEGPQEAVAAELDAAALRASARGAPAAAGALFERSAELSPDPSRRAQRVLNAAEADHLAGLPEAAERLLAMLPVGLLDERAVARVELLQARLAFLSERGRQATLMLLDAAKQLEALDPDLALDTRLEALQAVWFVGQAMPSDERAEIMTRAAYRRQAREATTDPTTDLLLKGLLERHNRGYAASVPALSQAVDHFLSAPPSTDPTFRRSWFAALAALDLLRDDEARMLTERFLSRVDSTGATAMRLIALTFHAVVLAITGALPEAALLLVEIEAASRGLGLYEPGYAELFVRAWQGESHAAELANHVARESESRGEGVGLVAAHWAQAVLFNSSARYKQALDSGLRAMRGQRDVGALTFLPAVEAVVAAAHLKDAAALNQPLSIAETMAAATGSDWALGLSTRCRAMATDDDGAEVLFREALTHLERTRVTIEQARTHLYFGEWLRRRGRRRDAAKHLRSARKTFIGLGAAGFARLAERELTALGMSVGAESTPSQVDLTPQERAIVEFARQGLTNAAIASRLFISARTVEWHLTRSYAKLGVSSRHELPLLT